MQIALTYDNPPAPAPVRRRIIQQPLRTEASFALIASDGTPIAELADRLKRTHPLITFPSLSHFLAEPPRRERWAAIVVARSGAWDPRLDAYVRGRGRMALFGLSEESYGWPEAVARVRDLSELEPWLQALDAPEPPPVKKERPKRSPRAAAAPAQQSARASKPAPAAPGEAAPQQLDAPRSQPAPAATPRAQQIELRLPRGKRKLREPKARPARAPKRAQPQPIVSTQELVRSILADDRPRRAKAPAVSDSKFALLAGELGLVRAFEILDELRARAMRLVRR